MSEGVQVQKEREQKRPASGTRDQKDQELHPRGKSTGTALLPRAQAAVEVYGKRVRKKPPRSRGGFPPDGTLFKYLRNLVGAVQAESRSTPGKVAVALLLTIESVLTSEPPNDSLLESPLWDQELVQTLLHILRTHSSYKQSGYKKRSQALIRILQTKLLKTPSLNMDSSSLSNDGRPSGTILASLTGSDPLIGISNILSDVGPACTWTTRTLRETLTEVAKSLPGGAGALNEASVARCVYFFADKSKRSGDVETQNNSVSSSDSAWNLSVVSQVISEDYSSLDWGEIAAAWDFPDFDIRNADQFRALLQLYRSGCSRDPPLSVFTREWRYPSGQCSLLETMLSVSPSVYACPLNSEEAADAATVGQEGQTTSSAPNPGVWASSDVLQRLLYLSDVPTLRERIRDLFVKGLLTCPEVLLCALVRLQLNVANVIAQGGPGSEGLANAGKQMKSELMRELIPLFFKPNPHHSVQNGPAALRRLWAISPNTVSAACVEAWRSTVSDAPQTRLATVVHIIGIARLLPSPESAMSNLLNASKDPEFSIAVAFVMADNDMFQLKPWLTERMSGGGSGPSTGVLFTVTLLSYLGKTYRSAMPRAVGNNTNEGKGAPLVSLENLAISLQLLQGLDSSMLSQAIPSSAALSSGESGSAGMTLGESIKTLSETCYTTHPTLRATVGQQQLMNTGANGQNSGRLTPPSSGNADDIEEMANSYFQKIYTSEQSIGEVVEMLKRFKASSDARENDIFACMIHNLFDEYRFFSKYPEKELRITGILFGTLIQQQLVSSITLGIALRYVLEALRKPPAPAGSTTHSSGKMFRFGMFALEQFKGRLHEWPQYCSHIVQIPHLKEGYADLVNEIEGAMAESQNRPSASSTSAGASSGGGSSNSSLVDVPKQQSGGLAGSLAVDSPAGTPVSSGSSLSGRAVPSQVEVPDVSIPASSSQPQRTAVFGPKLGRAVNGKLDDSQHESPPDAVLDRVQFLINNVSPSNVESKAQELKDMLEPTYFGWLGHYLVVKRISTQPNFHSLYLTFLDQLGDYGKGLIEAILSSVYLNVGKLLRSPKITTSTSERSLLKNLGSWLGQITLARNRPILQIMLDCKELLFQGYENGMLIAVTPFVAKILEGAKSSVIFRPPNPWLMSLLSVFRALYGVDDLKMNIKFEVEVLCKNLGVKPEDIPLRAADLTKRIPPVKERNPDFNTKSSMVGQTSSTPVGSSTTPPAAATLGAPALTSPDAKAGTGLGATAGILGSTGTFGVSGLGKSTAGTQEQHQTVIPNLASYVTINPSLNQLLQQSQGGTVSAGLMSTSLKRSVPIAVDRAIREIIQPVVERSVTIACITTKEIVTKDFAMESDENKMRKAAQLMVANLAGSLALVTCREPLRASISTHLRQLLTSSIGAADKLSEQEQNLVEQCVAICATDNLELGCMLIEKAATEKAVRDIDDAIGPAVSTRRKHREQTGQPFYDMSIFGNGSQRYPAALPEPLRPKPGGLRSEQLRVYEAFQRMPRNPSASNAFVTPGGTSAVRSSGGLTPGITAGNDTSVAGTGQQVNVEVLSAIAAKLNSAVTTLLSSVGPRAPEITLSMLPADHEVRQLLLAVQRVMPHASAVGSSPRALSSSEKEAALGFSQSVFKRLYELSLSEPLRLETLVSLLETINDYCPQLGQDIGTWATYAPTETESQRKLHRTVLLLLVRSRLISVAELDSYLSASAENGSNPVWVEFSLLFMRTAFLERLASPTDFPKLIDLMTKIAEGRSQASPQIIQSLRKPILRMVEELQGGRGSLDLQSSAAASAAGTVVPSSKQRHQHRALQESSSLSAEALGNLSQASMRAAESGELFARGDPPNAKQQVTFLLDSWIRKHSEAAGNEQILAQYLQLLQQQGVGKVEEQTERFFRLSTAIVVEAVLKTSGAGEGSTSGKALSYNFIDIYSNLVVLLIRYMNGGGSSEQVAAQRVALLNKILGVTVRCILSDYEKCKKESGGVAPHWDQRPWYRLLLNLVLDLNSPNPALDPISYGILSVLGAAFHMVQPLVIPGFAFAWLELISHRSFLPNLLQLKGQKGWNLAHHLLVDLLLFLEPHLRRTELTPPIKKLYEGTLRLLLTLLHDFPSFLAAYHLSLCNIIPENCVQLRNLILSAVPRGMVLPDPFTPNLKIDLLPEISQSPVILSNVLGPIDGIRKDLDAYLKDRQRGDYFISGLLPRLCREGTTEVDAAKVNSLVLYVGIQAIARPPNSQLAHKLAQTPEMEILQKLMDFDEKGRYISLNAIANQLRYPSSHTHYFSCVMLFLFSEAKNVAVKEQVTRVLLERLILHKPHPWGLLITFIELIKNQRYQFWSHPFTRCANEIEKVFESVARSCLTPGAQRSTAVGGDDRAQ